MPAPRSPAVLITLQETYVVGKGLTYAQILRAASERVELKDPVLSDLLHIRRTQGGARLLEIPKGTPEQAAQLVTKLRPALSGVADVVRPVKRVVVRIKDLDDSATKGGVVEAIYRITDCPGEALHVGEICQGGYGGMGVTFAFDAAKPLMDAGRVLVGWSSARFELLEATALLQVLGTWACACGLPVRGRSQRRLFPKVPKRSTFPLGKINIELIRSEVQ